MKRIKAIVNLDISATCPYCDHDMDLCLQENTFFAGNKLPDPDRTDSKEIFECLNCSGEFIVDELEY